MIIGQSTNSRSLTPGMSGPPMRGTGRSQVMPQAFGLIQPLPAWVWALAFAGVLWGLSTLYPLLTAACILTLPLLASLLLFKGEPPILFACCAIQWLQVVTSVFYANFFHTTLDKVLEFPELEKATWLSLSSTIILAVGMRTAFDSVGRGDAMAAKMEDAMARLSLPRLNQAWWAAFLVCSSLGAIAWKLGGLRQFATPILTIKWMIFFMLAYRVLARDEGYRFLLTILVVEFLSGFTGYFSSFKEVILMLVLVVLSLRRGLSTRIRGLVIAAVLIGCIASVFWSVIKIEYREFLQQQWKKKGGADTATRVDGMLQLLSTVNARKMEEGFKTLVARVSYTGLFGSTISHVPAFEPYARGELWLGVVQHILMPRIFFPNKKVLNDSERARRFTGLRLSGAEEGTSIGIGYVAESYADFGSLGMHFPIYLLGLFMGRIYRNYCLNKHSALLGAAIATAILFSVILALATSNAKIVGSLVTLCLAYSALNSYYGAGFMRWLNRK